MCKKTSYIVFLLFLISCRGNRVDIDNVFKGKLQATHELIASGDKKIYLDDDTAPKSPYMELIEDPSGERILTLLNPYKNAIYFYNYTAESYTGRIIYEREGPNAVLRLAGYHIKSMDSIYVYNRPLVEIALTDSSGHVKKRIALHSDKPNWPYYYPQYEFSTVNPIMEFNDKLILVGMQPFFIPDSLIDTFRFTAFVDLKTGRTDFHCLYPEELYGSNVNWGGPYFMQSNLEISPAGELIFSFPASHNLYRSQWNSKDTYTTEYSGSNVAGTIHSIDRDAKQTPNEVLFTHFLQQDLYVCILHDTWRKAYYRIMLQGITGAMPEIPVAKKTVIVIMMDEQFNYLGETVIGTGEQWNWKNSFVTAEGLNIEYIDEEDKNEDYLNFKIFKIKEL